MYMLLLQLSATNASDASEKTVTLSLMHEIQCHTNTIQTHTLSAKQSKARPSMKYLSVWHITVILFVTCMFAIKCNSKCPKNIKC